METPSSTRRVTRSQALAASGNSNNVPTSKKVEVIEKGVSKSRQRSGKKPLIDITNDSPIVGLAMGSLDTTPSSTFSKKRISSRSSNNSGTPGSGEALLRGQVKTLLQKVEEEAELSKFSLENVDGPFLHLKALVNSPMALLAPTPNNTPHVSNLSGNESADKNGFASVTSSPVLEQLAISQMVTEIITDRQKKEENVESDKSLITRSLLFDFSEKSEGSSDSSDCISVLTYYQQGSDEGSNKVKSSTEEDDASIWSIQVNASTRGEEEEEDDAEEEEEDEYEGEDDEEEECYDDEEGWMDDLCEGLSKISVNGTKFSGKHTRFVYNSDDELQGEEDCGDEIVDSPPSQGVLRLKGLPTPKGKHLRFPMED